jgi:hypothetical protein
MGAGVLRAQVAASKFTLTRHLPPDDLAPFLDYCWVVRWDLRGQPPHEQQILPHPNVNLAFEASGAGVFGVDRSIFIRRPAGEGKALGIRFRPGGFRPFYRKSIDNLNDSVVPARQVLGVAADEACTAAMSPDASDDAMVAAAVGLLRRARPVTSPPPSASLRAGTPSSAASDGPVPGKATRRHAGPNVRPAGHPHRGSALPVVALRPMAW